MSEDQHPPPSKSQQAQGKGIAQALGDGAKAIVVNLNMKAPGLGWAVLILACVLLIVGLLATFQGFSVAVSLPTPTPRPTPTPWLTPTPVSDEEILVLVATFKRVNGEADEHEVAGRIKAALDQTKDDMPDSIADTVLFSTIPLSFHFDESDDARDWGKKLKATLVIWGAYDNDGSTAFFEVIEDQCPDFNPVRVTTQPSPNPKQVNAYSLYFTEQLPSQSEFFVNFALGQIFLCQADYVSALPMFTTAINKAQQKAVDEANEYVNIDQNALAYAYFFRGYIYQIHFQDLEKALEKAEESYTEATARNENLGAAYNNLGVMYANQGKYCQAVSEFEKAVDTDETDSVAWENLGLAHMYCGDLEAAKNAYDWAMKIQPESAALHLYLAIWQARQGYHDDALREFNEALKIDNEYVPAYISRGSFRAWDMPKLANEDLQQACRLINVSNCTSETPVSESIPLEVYYNLGEVNRAFAEQQPDLAPTYLETAMAYYKKAIELNQSDPRAYYGIAWVNINLGNKTEAINNLLCFLDRNADPKFQEIAQTQLRELGHTEFPPDPAIIPNCASLVE